MATYRKQLTSNNGIDTIYPYTDTEAVYHNGELLQNIVNAKAPLASPQFTGAAKVAAGSDYTTGKLRNIYFSTSAPSASDGNNGDIWIVYTA